MTITPAAPGSTDELMNMIAETISHWSSHGPAKHHQQFNDETRPPVLRTPEHFRLYIEESLRDETTSIVKTRDISYIYNRKNETLIAINPMDKDGGTIFRTPPLGRNYETWHEGLARRTAQRDGLKKGEVTTQHGISFEAFLKKNPKYEESLRSEIKLLHQEKIKLNVARQRHDAARVAAAARKPAPHGRPGAPVLTR